MKLDRLPSILLHASLNSSISMERALKQIKELLENNIFDPTLDDKGSALFQAKLACSRDDIDLMLDAISRKGD